MTGVTNLKAWTVKLTKETGAKLLKKLKRRRTIHARQQLEQILLDDRWWQFYSESAMSLQKRALMFSQTLRIRQKKPYLVRKHFSRETSAFRKPKQLKSTKTRADVQLPAMKRKTVIGKLLLFDAWMYASWSCVNHKVSIVWVIVSADAMSWQMIH